MKHIFFVFILMFSIGNFSAHSQEPFRVVEINPEFPGGYEALSKFIGKNVRYPDFAQENGIQGKVYVEFVVLASGKIGTTRVVRGVHPSLDKEAVRVVKSMPRWKPGVQRGKAVPSYYILPINFVLNTSDDDKKKKKKKRKR